MAKKTDDLDAVLGSNEPVSAPEATPEPMADAPVDVPVEAAELPPSVALVGVAQPLDTPDLRPAMATQESAESALYRKFRAGEDLSDAELQMLLRLDDKKSYTQYMLEREPKVRFFVPLDSGEKITTDKVTGEKLYPLEYVSISEVVYHVPKGIYVDVPQTVAALLAEHLQVPTQVQVVPMMGAIRAAN